MKKSSRKTVAIITGTRAEFGLLRPVIDAVRKHKGLKLQLIAAGAHFLPPARTIREVEAAYPVAARVPMQRAGASGRLADAAATARGIAGFTKAFIKLKPDWVVVLGDRIEAFAAASAASIGGIGVAHIHGGDRAEGIADEAMRHAITKLSHLHLPATQLSAERVVKMGEPSRLVHVVGSPAIDGLSKIKPMSDRAARAIGDPRTVVLLHPSGLGADEERRCAAALARAVVCSCVSPVLILAPNHDSGREQIVAAFRAALDDPARTARWTFRDHLPRAEFLALLRRLALAEPTGLLVGNSSAGLIEAAALGVPVINVGPRQAGRERTPEVLDVPFHKANLSPKFGDALAEMLQRPRASAAHPYGDGRAGPRIAALLAKTDPHDPVILRKRNAY